MGGKRYNKVPISTDVGRAETHSFPQSESDSQSHNPGKILQEFKSQVRRMGEIPSSFKFKGEEEGDGDRGGGGRAPKWKRRALESLGKTEEHPRTPFPSKPHSPPLFSYDQLENEIIRKVGLDGPGEPSAGLPPWRRLQTRVLGNQSTHHAIHPATHKHGMQ